VKEKGELIPLAKLKLLKADPARLQAQSEESKARYSKILECKPFNIVGGRSGPGLRNFTGRKVWDRQLKSGKQRPDTAALPDAVEMG
jgi:hypothetical protein